MNRLLWWSYVSSYVRVVLSYIDIIWHYWQFLTYGHEDVGNMAGAEFRSWPPVPWRTWCLQCLGSPVVRGNWEALKNGSGKPGLVVDGSGIVDVGVPVILPGMEVLACWWAYFHPNSSCCMLAFPSAWHRKVSPLDRISMAKPRCPIERTSMDLQPNWSPTCMQQVLTHLDCIYHSDPLGSCEAWLAAAEIANQTQPMVASLNRNLHDQDVHCRTIISGTHCTDAGFLYESCCEVLRAAIQQKQFCHSSFSNDCKLQLVSVRTSDHIHEHKPAMNSPRLSHFSQRWTSS